MPRPADQLPRVVRLWDRVTGYTEVYAAWCYACASDDYTHWDKLPTIEELTRAEWMPDPSPGIAYCTRDIHRDRFGNAPPIKVSREECWAAREPERLEVRLRELKEHAHA
jgi:hypothetical protein